MLEEMKLVSRRAMRKQKQIPHAMNQIDVRKQLPVPKCYVRLNTGIRELNRYILKKPPFIQFLLEDLPSQEEWGRSRVI